MDSGLTFPAGHVIQVQSTIFTDGFRGANNTKASWQDITPLTVSLTNKLSTSKVLINSMLTVGVADNYPQGIRLIRRVNGTDTPIGINTNTYTGLKGTITNFNLPSYGSTQSTSLSIIYLDTTDATSVTYKLQYYIHNISVINFDLNQTESDTTTTNHGISTITAMEIAQ